MNLKQFKSRKQKILFVVMMMLCVMFLAGCNTNTDSDVYKYVKNQTDSLTQNGTTTVKEDANQLMIEKAFAVSNVLKSSAPWIIIGSILIGAYLLKVVQNDQAIRKNAIFVFIIGIPVLDIILTYGMAFIAGMFL